MQPFKNFMLCLLIEYTVNSALLLVCILNHTKHTHAVHPIRFLFYLPNLMLALWLLPRYCVTGIVKVYNLTYMEEDPLICTLSKGSCANMVKANHR